MPHPFSGPPDLQAYIVFVRNIHNDAVIALNKRMDGKYAPIELSAIVRVIRVVATKMAEYNINHSIYPRTFDAGKFVCFVAAELFQNSVLAKSDNPQMDLFAAQPLYFGYLGFLDETYCDNCSLREIGLFSILAENMCKFLHDGQWSASFAYLRAMEVTLEFCSNQWKDN